MEDITREAIASLLAETPPRAPAVTIYVPTHVSASPPHMTEDQIRLKNLIHKAVGIIKNRDDGRAVQRDLCDRLEQLLVDRDFWEMQTKGLLICARPGMLRMFRLPFDTEEYVAVADHFHLAPIFGVLEDLQEYYVLAVAQHKPRLFTGTLYELHDSGIALPETLEQGLHIDELNQKSEQQASAVGSSMNTGGYNGRGGAKNPAEDERLRFWRMLDQVILNKANTTAPLILAGIDSETAEYRSISHHPNVLKTTIEGSYGGAQPHEVFAKAEAILRTELLNREHERIIDEYNRAKGQAPQLAAQDVAAIVDAADQGRIDKLLIAGVRVTTDTVRDNSEPVPVITFPAEPSAQVFHDIAYRVWNTSGTVVDIEADHMPERGALMLATLRY
ncbi:MAG TPA: hypothetical protein VFN56_04150 [Candidatus Saccharimonadales bacterium]|nr:hypothetical protein [Candidatus Saccharimonadales bacterium]